MYPPSIFPTIVLLYIWGTVVITNLQFKIKIGKKSWKLFTQGISFDIFSGEYYIGNPE